jgi:hypothetical protein
MTQTTTRPPEQAAEFSGSSIDGAIREPPAWAADSSRPSNG